jgi:Flp pilus assembly protein TadB
VNANVTLLVAGLAAAVAAALAARIVIAPTRRLKPRIQVYAQLSRSRLGTGVDIAVVGALDPADQRGPVRRVLGPIVAAAASRLSGVIDAGGDEALALRLRQAGFVDTSPEQHRIRQLGWTVAGTAAGTAFGLAVAHSAGLVLACTMLGAVIGATHWRGKVNKAIAERRARMRVELYTVSHLLAIYARTGHGPTEAVREVCDRGHGPVIDELREALGWINGGTRPQQAWERLAELTPEPAAARLYRLLASFTTMGGDITTPLLRASDELRTDRREEVERLAVKRRGAMLIPTIALMAPVVLLFIIAALPTVVFGR